MDQYAKNDLEMFLNNFAGPVAFVVMAVNVIFSIALMPFTIAFYNFQDGHYVISIIWIVGFVIGPILQHYNTLYVKKGFFKKTRYYDNLALEIVALSCYFVSVGIVIFNFYIFFKKYKFSQIFLIDMF